ncbi:class I SAM-dependent DNA methyltransferase [Macrococcus brunensis]|uniref:class I SAM-dependent DNA methyltransferase n=1 Tax=Macrococcus brunensis TaxID=198483 RepID=UPI001EF12725|nr:class I SAM-dependent methyltransferase [Macrococcus brunensis]ULG71149.1 class I SAM-dependent methyltransferase [Macrococcus brunensis]ULG73484.1 class I SAM-dependent methyltransferase [Macrococcus brunensis]
MTYEAFAVLYDELMYDQPYDKWLELTVPYLNGKQSILDLACGTGSFTTLLPKRLDRVGVDLSEDMLTVAQTKDPSIQWLVQDMTALELDMTFDVITCFCDSMNYVTTEEDLNKLFSHVYMHLEEDGVFLFDVHSVWKMTNLFDGQTYSDETEHVTYLWQTEPGEEENSVYHDMSFFTLEEDGRYRRFDESHYQRTFPLEFYIELLETNQFTVEKVFADFNTDRPIEEDAERIFYVARKKCKR